LGCTGIVADAAAGVSVGTEMSTDGAVPLTEGASGSGFTLLSILFTASTGTVTGALASESVRTEMPFHPKGAPVVPVSILWA
jgi:hypothetical protein